MFARDRNRHDLGLDIPVSSHTMKLLSALASEGFSYLAQDIVEPMECLLRDIGHQREFDTSRDGDTDTWK
jgi:hypothetical protein